MKVLSTSFGRKWSTELWTDERGMYTVKSYRNRVRSITVHCYSYPTALIFYKEEERLGKSWERDNAPAKY